MTPLSFRSQFLSRYVLVGAALLALAVASCSDDADDDDPGSSDVQQADAADTGSDDVETDMGQPDGDTPDTDNDAGDTSDDVDVSGDVDTVADCGDTCSACEDCELVDGASVCVSTCGDELTCADGVCVRAAAHADLAELAGPFATGPEVTAACIDCHEDEAEAFLDTAHWNWLGDTPDLEGHEGEDVGKANLINNFCVAIPTNEGRCSQCHSGYGWRDDTFDFGEPTNIDCLVCHSDPASGYARGMTNADVAEGVDLLLAAQSVGETSRQNCGSCHFMAGGGDNVKLGDMGSALANPTPEIDVHMGGDMACATCHAGDDHTLLGRGVHLPVTEGDLACADCHTTAPHDTGTYNEHALDIACQTCHVPTFSRTQPTKMDWDWSTAGNRTIGTDGISTVTIDGGAVVQDYNFKKGSFVWEMGVTPTYGWYDGRVTRMTINDVYAEGQGTEENPVELGGPVAGYDDEGALIYPFKVMRGVQPAHLAERLVLVPHLFGPGGFWGGIPSADDYTAEAVRALWTTALRNGAVQAGQLESDAVFDDEDWDWVFTEMYLGINHEVAPADAALGSGGCSDCHSDSGPIDWEALGYTCDPMTDAEGCGSRHR